MRGKAKYRLVDEKVRVFVAPPIQDIESSAVRMRIPCSSIIVLTVRPCTLPSVSPPPQLKPYVSTTVRASVSKEFNKELYGGKLPRGGLTPEHFFKVARRVPTVPADVPSPSS